jgi:hypothetical protein
VSNPAATGRKSITEKLHLAARYYLTKKMYSVHHELGVLPWGQRKVDIFAFDSKLDHVVICEVKSGAADYGTDIKWQEYLPFCHKFYFVIDTAFWDSKGCNKLRADAKAAGAGILVLGASGVLESKLSAKGRSELPKGFLKTTITKLAWRLGAHRGNTRAGRVYLNKD